MIVLAVLCAMTVGVHGRPRIPRKPTCSDELHKATTAWASNDAETLAKDYYRLYDQNRESLITSDYYLPNSWLHHDGQDIQGKDPISAFLLTRPRNIVHTFR